jgi:mannose-1-phosphate guanylyltransferase
LLLAGGFGTRLRPLTYTRPKHLLPIANRPHIEHVFDLLDAHGISEVILTTSYLAEAFGETVARARERGMTVQVTHEEVALGTAGALKHAEAEIGVGTFLVFNGDVLTDVDLGEVVAFHRNKGALGTIVLTPVEDPSAFGVVPTDEGGRVTGFIEKPAREDAPTDLINAGIYVLEPAVLDRIPAGKEWSVERALFPELVAQGAPLYARSTDAYWMDVGTPDKYRQANIDTIRGRFKAREGVALAQDAEVHPGAGVTDSCVGPGGVLEEGARVVSSVLLAGCRVGAGALVEDSILGEGVVVEPGERVVEQTIGDFGSAGGAPSP